MYTYSNAIFRDVKILLPGKSANRLSSIRVQTAISNICHTLTVKVAVGFFLNEGAGAEIDKLQVESLEIHQQVFIFDISVDNPFYMTSHDRLDHLTEEVARQTLLEHAFFGDKVKEVLARFGSFHDDQERVVTFEAVEDLDDSGTTVDLLQ